MKNLRIETELVFDQALRNCWKELRDDPQKARLTRVEHLTEQLEQLGYQFVQVTTEIDQLITFDQGPHNVSIENDLYVVVPKGWIEEQRLLLDRKYRFRS